MGQDNQAWMDQQEQNMLNEPSETVYCETCEIEDGIKREAVGNNSDGSAACDEHLLPGDQI